MTVDPNDPETKKEYNAFIEHEKHEPLGERAEDLGNREPTWIWVMGALTLIATLAGLARWCL